ncbi:serine/threonine-protein kinase [Nocardioides pantholopis]|uniref:serine/threonine-protein kinase n=1 Tax=Nocardioides pantholopis TaxID=2483798 RepID=UPI000F08B491|nr:serine/threonine-protein kinase [Nocardioides pantholopis]
MWERWDAVAASARGLKSDYRLDDRPLGAGGQATVVRGEHRTTGLPVAFKRLRPGLVADADARARLRREVQIGTQLRHPNVVAVLDSNVDEGWFVMPLAAGTLESMRESVAEESRRIETLLRQVGAGLSAAHELGWTHRDVKPANILIFTDGSTSSPTSTWVVADWGLGRRPDGATTAHGRTVVGVAYGSEGFAAPELAEDAHRAGPTADIYSLGQVAGWVLTGRLPRPNIPLRPDDDPWRSVVDRATRMDPNRRPPDIESLLEIVVAEMAPMPEAPTARAQLLLAEAGAGQPASGVALMNLALSQATTSAGADHELLTDLIPALSADVVRLAVTHHSEMMRDLIATLETAADDSWIPFRTASSCAIFLVRCLEAALDRSDDDTAEAALQAFCRWDETYDQWDAQRALRPVLRRVRGVHAERAARILRRHPESAAHFSDLVGERDLDPALRGVLAAAGG